MSIVERPRISYNDFVASLNPDTDEAGDIYANDDIQSSLNMLGRTLAESDLQSGDVKAYVLAALPDLCQFYGVRFKSSPLVKSYFEDEDLDQHDNSNSRHQASRRLSRSKKAPIMEKEVLKHRNNTVVMPVISMIAKDLFKTSLEIAGSSAFEDYLATEIDKAQVHHSDPLSMKWGHPPDGSGYYGSVIMDKEEYHAGQDVMVNPGEDANLNRAKNAKTAAAQSANSYANRLWFCRICYFFERESDGAKMFHGQWFIHGSKTILQETAHSRSLFLSNECEDNPVASIFKKCKITMLHPEEVELPDDGRPKSNDFHCGLMYDEKNVEFLDIPDSKEIDRLFSLTSRPCVSCAMRYEKRQAQNFAWDEGSTSFSYAGADYHIYDFIYVRPETTTGLLDVAQIVKIRQDHGLPKLILRYFDRADHFVKPCLPCDDRRLYATNRFEELENPLTLDGHCHVRHLVEAKDIDEWIRYNDHFYFNQEERSGSESLSVLNRPLKFCTTCHVKRMKMLKDNSRLLERNGPITCLELFSGAGGLGTGLNLSGFVNTKFAVEFSPSAAATYKANHPHATVYCQDSSLLLKHAILMEEGENPKPLMANDGKTTLPPMPRKGTIDMISGGPPCQSFSRANHNPRADDIRSTLPCNMLSYVEHYNPRYFLLENVVGLLNYRLLSTHGKNKRTLEGGIQAGMVKFVMRSLIALGYQVRCRVLQAAHYGAPQSRQRVIFWGAKRGITIPEYPVPVYAWSKTVHCTNLPTGQKLHPISRSADETHQCAPLPPRTVNATIGDLPRFDWINPHEIIPIKDRDKKEIKRRLEEGIAQFDAVLERKSTALPGYPEGAEYLTEPMNRYQKMLRQQMRDDAKVELHFTKTFSSRIIEATTSVPMRPWANHRDLPLALQPNHAKPGAGQSQKSFYGRLNGASQFKCALTTAAPNTKESWLIHPSQKRIMTVRELARSQGFPDHYIFKSIDQEPQRMILNQVRQIGNAVPVPLAFHLGQSLGEALLKEWRRNEREGSPAV